MHQIPASQFNDEYFFWDESLLLRAVYSAQHRQCEIVIDYAAQVVSDWFEAQLADRTIDFEAYQNGRAYHKEFRRFVFTQVSGVTWPTELQNVSKPVLLLGADLTSRPGPHSILIYVQGEKRIAFRFSAVRVESRLVRSEPVVGGRNARYFDLTNSTEVDYYTPFPGYAWIV